MPINAISREWRPRVPLVHQSHDSQILLALPHRLVVQAGAVHARQPALPAGANLQPGVPTSLAPVQLHFQPADFLLRCVVVRLSIVRFAGPPIPEDLRQLFQRGLAISI